MAQGYSGDGWKPLRDRSCHVFLSHAHVDRSAVERLRDWLQKAGLETWYDADKMQAGARFPSALADGIGESKGMIVAISKDAIASNWVNDEENHGLAQQGLFRRFVVVPVRLEPCDLPRSLFSHSAVDGFGGQLDGHEAARLLRSLRGVSDLTPPPVVKADVIAHISSLAGDPPSSLTTDHVPILYVTCGWRDTGNEAVLRNAVCEAFLREHFHLIGDAEDHPHTNETRIKSIMSGCSGQLIVLPRRADSINAPEYKNLRAEIQIGRSLGLNQFVIAEQGLQLGADFRMASLSIDASELASNASVGRTIRQSAEDIREQWGPPKNPHYVFVATDYEDLAVKDHVVRHIAQITGLPCLRGSDFGRQMPSRKIELAIRNAALVIANVVSVTGPTGFPNVNWNACIEAGIAMGAGRQVHIIARRGDKDRWRLDEHLPFMIRHNTVETYGDDQNLIGLVHRYAHPFRRRVIGADTKP